MDALQQANGIGSIPLTLYYEYQPKAWIQLPCQARRCGSQIGGGDLALTSLLLDGHVTVFGTW